MSIYFIQRGANGPIKIGYSINVARRRHSLQNASPEKLKVIGVIDDATMADEKEIHERFRRHRIRGEWFKPDPEIRDMAKASRAGKTLDEIDRAYTEKLPPPTFVHNKKKSTKRPGFGDPDCSLCGGRGVYDGPWEWRGEEISYDGDCPVCVAG